MSTIYSHYSIDHDPVECTWEEVRNSLDMEVPRTFPIVDLFRVIYPTAIVTMVIREVHRGDGTYDENETSEQDGAPVELIDVYADAQTWHFTSSEADYVLADDAITIVRWAGRISGVKEMRGAKAVLQCDPDSVSMDRMAPGVPIQIPCYAQLFDQDCGLDREDFKHDTEVLGIDRLYLIVASIGALDSERSLPYAGGEAWWIDGEGNTNVRVIERIADNVLTLTRPFYGMGEGALVTLYPACAKDMGTCDGTYNNKENHRGNPHLTTVNAMDGRQVF